MFVFYPGPPHVRSTQPGKAHSAVVAGLPGGGGGGGGAVSFLLLCAKYAVVLLTYSPSNLQQVKSFCVCGLSADRRLQQLVI